MTDSAPGFPVQALLGLVVVPGIVWWFTRPDRTEFRLWRVFGVTLAAGLLSALFVAAWWWFAPEQTDRHSPLLLAAVFVPLYALVAWCLVIGHRRASQKKHNPPSA